MFRKSGKARCPTSLLDVLATADRLACWRGSLEHVARGWNEFSAENSQSVADASSCLKLNGNRALCAAICSVLTVDTQERSLALYLHWSHQVAEVTFRIVRIELNDARGCAPSPELGTQGDSLAPRSVHAQACRRRALRRCLQFVSVDEFQRPRRFGWSCVNLRHSEFWWIPFYQGVPRRYAGYTPNV